MLLRMIVVEQDARAVQLVYMWWWWWGGTTSTMTRNEITGIYKTCKLINLAPKFQTNSSGN